MNEHHIERIMKSYRTNPTKWIYGGESVCAYRTLCTAYNNVEDGDAVLKRLGGELYSGLSLIARAAILCLIVYEDCDYMMDASLAELKILSNLGDQRASLIYPACRIMNKNQTIKSYWDNPD